jgi:hypothetical protein
VPRAKKNWTFFAERDATLSITSIALAPPIYLAWEPRHCHGINMRYPSLAGLPHQKV